MMNDYRVVFRKQDLSSRISSYYRQQQIAIGLLDHGSKEELIKAIEFYEKNINVPLYVLTTEYRFDEFDIAKDYYKVNYIVFKNASTTGDYINVFSNECNATYFLVVSSESELISFEGKTLLKIMEEKTHPVLISPVMISSQADVLPTLRLPFIRGKEIDPLSFLPDLENKDIEETLYPIMEFGFYDRALFQRLRSYDTLIKSDYYQALDFGVRCYLMGYSIVMTKALAVMFPSKVSIIEDKSECQGIKRFYTKALSIKRISGKNVAEKYKPYYDKETFNEDVKKKQILLQKIDFQTLIDNWKIDK